MPALCTLPVPWYLPLWTAFHWKKKKVKSYSFMTKKKEDNFSTSYINYHSTIHCAFNIILKKQTQFQ